MLGALAAVHRDAMVDAFRARSDEDAEKLVDLAPDGPVRVVRWLPAAGPPAAADEAEAERKAGPGTPDAVRFAAQSCVAWAQKAVAPTKALPVSPEQPPLAMALAQADAGSAEFVGSDCSLPTRHSEAAQLDVAEVVLAAWERRVSQQ